MPWLTRTIFIASIVAYMSVLKANFSYKTQQKVAVKTQADCGISGLPDKKEMY